MAPLRYAPIKRVAHVTTGDMPARVDGGEVPVIGANGPIGVTDRSNLDQPAIVVGRVGSAGAVNFVDPPAWISDNALVVVPLPQIMDYRFACHLLSTMDFARHAVQTAQPLITQTLVREWLVPLPALSAQRVIADYLDAETARIDALVSARKRQAGLLDARMEAERESWLQVLRDRYGVVALKRLSHRVEQGWSPECDATPAEEGEWGVLKTSSVSSGSFDRTENKRLPATIQPDPRWIIRDGDLLVVRGSGSPSAVGQAAVAEVGTLNLLLSDLLYRVRLPDSNPAFVAAALRSRYGRGQLEASIRTDVGMTRKIRSDDLAGVLVPAAPRSAQDAAVDALRRTEGRLALLRQRLYRQVDLLVERRQALITAAVAGELEIPGVAA
jgi:restriction endonuclease S subunit